MKKLYAGIDLHSNNNFLGIVDGKGKRVFKKKLSNGAGIVLEHLRPFKKELIGIVVESTYNWYWLVDALQEEGYPVHLANPAAMVQYSGKKHAGDQDDAFWLAEMLRLGIWPEGYIYPKEDRPIRDLLRKRGHLVRLRTSLILSLQNIITRNCGVHLNGNEIKRFKTNPVAPLLVGQEDLALSGKVSKETIDFLTRQINQVEKVVQDQVKLKDPYRYLETLCGVGKILSLTIMLETGPIERFSKVGHYASYCRKVPSQWTSNHKTKGKGNKKNGNKYLAWAFSEAAELARRYDNQARAYYNKKSAKTNFMTAHTALAHKLARAAYFVMRDQVPFEPGKVFA
jgi:transposase